MPILCWEGAGVAPSGVCACWRLPPLLGILSHLSNYEKAGVCDDRALGQDPGMFCWCLQVQSKPKGALQKYVPGPLRRTHNVISLTRFFENAVLQPPSWLPLVPPCGAWLLLPPVPAPITPRAIGVPVPVCALYIGTGTAGCSFLGTRTAGCSPW